MTRVSAISAPLGLSEILKACPHHYALATYLVDSSAQQGLKTALNMHVQTQVSTALKDQDRRSLSHQDGTVLLQA